MLRRIVVLLVIVALFLATGYLQDKAGTIAEKARALLTRGPAKTTPSKTTTPSSGVPQQVVYEPSRWTKADTETMVTVYFRDADAMYLVPVSRSVPKTLAVVKSSLQELFKGPARDSGLYPSAPDMDVARLNLKTDGYLAVDLPEETVAASTGMGSAGSAVAMDAIIGTLSEFDAVKQVQFLSNGKVTPTIFHGVAADRPFAVAPHRSENGEAILYMALYAGKRAYLVPERVNLGLGPNPAVPDAMRAALDALKKEVKRGDFQLYPTVPTDVQFKSVSVKDRVASIDVNSKLLTVNATDKAKQCLMLDAIIFTATAFPQVGSVQITVDGKVVDQAIGHVNIGKPLTRPKWINPEPRTIGGGQ